MAALAMMIGGAAVNAVAFTGSGYLFKALDKNGYAAETKRHNLASEHLQKANAEWEEHRKQTIDFANLQLKQEHDAKADFQNADYALTLYNQLHPTNKQIIRKKPVLKDYYTPSNEMKNYEYLWIILGMGGVGFAIYMYKASLS